MGKAIKMEKLKTANARQNTFSKRKNGIIKKARELSILCDVDVLVLMFSPAGKPTLYLGEYSNISMVLARFLGISLRERARRKCEIMEVRPNSSFLGQTYAYSVAVLMKMFKRLGRDIDTKALKDESERKEELKIQLRVLQAMSADAKFRLSCWVAPEKVDSLVQIEQMEKSLVKSLEQLQSHKEQLIPQLPEHHALCGRPSEIATL